MDTNATLDGVDGAGNAKQGSYDAGITGTFTVPDADHYFFGKVGGTVEYVGPLQAAGAVRRVRLKVTIMGSDRDTVRFEGEGQPETLAD